MDNSDTQFDQLLQEAQSPVRGYLIRLTGSVHVAQDLLQTANVTAIESQADFSCGTNLVAWLRQIAVNHYRNHVRRQTVSRSVALVDERLHDLIERRHRERQEHQQKQDDWSRLNDCLQRLPGHQRDIVKRFYLNGQSLADLAQLTGRTSNAVGQILHRARRTLLHCVGNTTTQPVTDATANKSHTQQGAETK